MVSPKLRTQIKASMSDKVSERLVKLEVTLTNLIETLSLHIATEDETFKKLVNKIEDLQASLTAVLLKNATADGERAALEKMAKTYGALAGGIFAGAISIGTALIGYLTR